MARRKGKKKGNKSKATERNTEEIAAVSGSVVEPEEVLEDEPEEGEEEESEEVEKKPLINPDLVEITTTSDDIQCMFCQRSVVDEPQYGKLYKLNTVVAHLFCILFSSGISQEGADHEGIDGLLEQDILKEYRRGKKLKCKYCRKPHATIGCVVDKCKTSFHFTCGSDNGTLSEFTNPFPSYCTKHKWHEGKYTEVISYIPEGPWGPCEICLQPCEENEHVMCPPCCKEKVYHKLCLQRHASFFGSYHMRCPNLECENKWTFIKFLRKAGVHVPVRDAAWEKEERFEAMKKLRYKCDAIDCLCEDGRMYNNKNVPYRMWKIIRCGSCGGSGTHMHCSNLKKQRWKCPECNPTLKRGYTPIACHSDDDSSDSGESEQEVPDAVESPNIFFDSDGTKEAVLVTKGPPSSKSGTEAFYDRDLKKKFRVVAPVQTAMDSDSESDDEVAMAVMETIVTSKPLDTVGPVTGRRNSAKAKPIAAASSAATTSACIRNINQTNETTENVEVSLISTETTKNSEQSCHDHDPISSSSSPVSEGLHFEDIWTEVTTIPTVQSTPSQDHADAPMVSTAQSSPSKDGPDATTMPTIRSSPTKDRQDATTIPAIQSSPSKDRRDATTIPAIQSSSTKDRSDVPTVSTVQSPPTKDGPNVARKRKSNTPLASPAEKRNSPVQELIYFESALNEDCFDEGRPCSPEITLIENTSNSIPSAIRNQTVAPTQHEIKRAKKKLAKKTCPKDDDICIIRDTRVQHVMIIKPKKVPLIILDDSDDDDDKASR